MKAAERKWFPADNPSAQSLGIKVYGSKNHRADQNREAWRFERHQQSGTRTELTSVSHPGKQTCISKAEEGISSLPWRLISLSCVHHHVFFLKRHVWGQEQIFWLNVACSKIATKVRHESLSSQSKGKHMSTKALLSLLWLGVRVTSRDSLHSQIVSALCLIV